MVTTTKKRRNEQKMVLTIETTVQMVDKHYKITVIIY